LKRIIKKLSHRTLGVIPALALLFAVTSADAACFFLFHQPDVPEELKKRN
jgi:cyclic lactone autoinducer peptide